MPKGKKGFQKGQIANPLGKNGVEGFAPWKIRVQQIMNKYGTVGEIARAVKDGRLSQEHPIDGMIVKHIVDSFIGEDRRLQREAFFDRLEGKPKEFKQVRVIKGLGDLTEEELAALAGEDT